MDADKARQLLEAARTRVQAALDAARKDAEAVESEDVRDVHEPPFTEELETYLGLVETHEDQLREVEEAFARLDAGTYGICEPCGKSIPDERLEAVPTARYHAEHEPTDRVAAPKHA